MRPVSGVEEALRRWTELRRDLGERPPFAPHLPDGHLTLHETNEAIRRAALLVGLHPRAEYVVHRATPPARGKIDWALLRADGTPVAAVEIEGREAQVGSLELDRWKLRAIDVRARFVVLHQLDHDLLPRPHKPHGPDYRASVRNTLGLPDVEVLLDVDVWHGALLRALWPYL